ncbi:MAG: thiolase family protein [Planctomycetes bacterium]|nr:thiolase family protein [Planctomycetota bacterium]
MSPVAIIEGVRTPFCKAGGRFRHVAADDLGAAVVRELLARSNVLPAEVDEVIFGCVAQPPHASNIARVIALRAGLPVETIAQTVQRNCASGIQAVTTGAMLIEAGRADLIVAGGTESMSQIPLLYGPEMSGLMMKLARAKTVKARLRALMGFRPKFLRPIIGLQLGLTDPVCGLNMGQTAEVLAREFVITREEQDAFALLSHERASAAMERGDLADEVMPLIGTPMYDTAIAEDDGPRKDQSLSKLARLRPYFDRHAGSVTIGNACPVTDGAAAVLLCSDRKAKELGLKPLGHVREWAYAALAGDRMGLGPVYATAKLLSRTRRTMRDFDLIELNEAFAAQVIANERAFSSARFAREHLGRERAMGEIDRDTLNVNGGAIAMGHPVGATGTRLILTALKQLRRTGKGRALATLCVGGGQGAAIVLEAA